jgi:1-acyl-sn-glycerol-3-phosphate acyltransferase
MTRAIKFFLVVLYGLYAWSILLVAGLITLALTLLAPTLKARRALGSFCAKVWLRLVGVSVELRGAELLSASPVVVVANHSSYIDGLLLQAVLPSRFAFVIKKEMRGVPLAGWLLRRLGAEFVDRFNRHSGAMDARRLLRSATTGSSLVFFPEGTFTGKPGLARFHGGAFAIAARSKVPVIPVVIRGARRILRGDSIWPRPGRVHIEILQPMHGGEDHTADLLRDQSRARMLLALDEPDLAHEDGVAQITAQRKQTSHKQNAETEPETEPS